jgi:hypothetical protein
MFPIDYKDWFEGSSRFAVQCGCFDVSLTPLETRWHYDVDVPQPCHTAVLKPLLEIASECWFYGIKPDSKLASAVLPLAEKTRGKYRLKATPDLALSNPRLWNAHGWERGSIAIAAKLADSQLANVFAQTHRVGVTDNFRTGHSDAAIKYARKKTNDSDYVCFLLPASNGLEWMTIFASPSKILRLYELACRSCAVTDASAGWYASNS